METIPPSAEYHAAAIALCACVLFMSSSLLVHLSLVHFHKVTSFRVSLLNLFVCYCKLVFCHYTELSFENKKLHKGLTLNIQREAALRKTKKSFLSCSLLFVCNHGLQHEHMTQQITYKFIFQLKIHLTCILCVFPKGKKYRTKLTVESCWGPRHKANVTCCTFCFVLHSQ